MAEVTVAISNGPVIQVSIDVSTVDEAIGIGKMALRAGADWIEYGTPLVLFQGIPSMTRFSDAFRGVPIFCDIKIVDGASKYVEAARRHGADYVSVCGVATDATIRAAVETGRQVGTTLVADLYATDNPAERSREVVNMGAGLVYLHYGGDQRAADPEGDETLALIPIVKRTVAVPVGVVTFDAEGAVAAVRAGADIVVIGHPYLTGPDAEPMLGDYVTRVRAAARAQRTPAGGLTT